MPPRVPARFLLKLDCETTDNGLDDQGQFKTVAWVSPPPESAPIVIPDTDNLPLMVGDKIAFAVGINGSANPTGLTWLNVVLTASTDPHQRSTRYANNSSPFRMNGTTTPLSLLLINGTFQRYAANGAEDANGPYIGSPYFDVVKDATRGSSAPTWPPTSKYEATIVASLTVDGTVWQYSYDPEMDVDNGNPP
jgi:hypothetical protein